MNEVIQTTVQFQVCDLVHPRRAEVLWELYGRNRLEGKVLAVTEDGLGRARYLVVSVPGVSEPVIVPESEVCLPSAIVDDELASDSKCARDFDGNDAEVGLTCSGGVAMGPRAPQSSAIVR
jgi:hypothetical protein